MLAIWERQILKKIFGRKIVRKRWVRRTNQKLQQLYGEPNLVEVAKASRIRWIGHAVRLPVGRQPKRIFKSEPGGKRRRGRPKARWKKEVQEDIAKLRIMDWRTKANDRKG
ncbi:hypothetical protein ILUMI_14009 [Ignelater luminosus]|uniref:Uncharacterized protein n=1 Tax=Ignelater luminosus TaxID=2038154 RepID=A0A8K0CRA1_IGNLU|nr:hypothetical protein ILUMI_14009 [Ignelater luminosus]